MQCPFCNQTISDNSAFCSYCGNTITYSYTQQPPQNQQQPYPPVYPPQYPPQYQQPYVPDTQATQNANKPFPAWLAAVIGAVASLIVCGGIGLTICLVNKTPSNNVVEEQLDVFVESSRRETDISTAECIRSAILADIADQSYPYNSDGIAKQTTPVELDDYYLPTSMPEVPTMRGSDFSGQHFMITWDIYTGTADVYDATGTLLLTDSAGASAYKSGATSAPADQVKTVN